MAQLFSITAILSGQTIGCFLMLILQGMAISSLIHYLQTYRKEPLIRNLLILPLFLVCTFQTLLVLIFTYRLLVLGWGSIDAIIQHDWVIDSQPIYTAICLAGAQGFYARRLWLLINKKWILIAFCIAIPVAFVIQMVVAATGFLAPHYDSLLTLNHPEVIEFEERWKPVFILGSSVNVAIDVAITSGMLYTLYKAKNTMDTATQSIISRLTMLILETMALPTICQILTTTFHSEYGDINSIERVSSYCQSPLCVISLLTTLLARKALRRMMNSDQESLPDIPLTKKSSEGQHINGSMVTRSRGEMSSNPHMAGAGQAVPPGILRDWQTGSRTGGDQPVQQNDPWDRGLVRGGSQSANNATSNRNLVLDSRIRPIPNEMQRPFSIDVEESVRAEWRSSSLGGSPVSLASDGTWRMRATSPGRDHKTKDRLTDGKSALVSPDSALASLRYHPETIDDLTAAQIRLMTRRREAE